jgi:hypothetical protein
MDKQTLKLVGLLLGIVAVGLYLLDNFGLGRRPTAFSAIAAALITFFWFISGARRNSIDNFGSAMRTAMAASLTVLYIVLIGIFSFWQPYFHEGEEVGTPDITTLLINNFTYLMGVVIAFYFGSSAFVEAKRESGAGSGDTPK